MTDELVSLVLSSPDDVLRARHLVRTTAARLGLGVVDQTRVATAVSEASRVVVETSSTGRLSVRQQCVASRRELVVVLDVDGPMPPALQRGGAGSGPASRLMDAVTIGPKSVSMRKALPQDVAVDLDALRAELSTAAAVDPLVTLREQNGELTEALAALRDREADLVEVNQELQETNRGVVALYAELEQRAEQVRQAQRLVFEELEQALRPPPPVVPGVRLEVRYLPAQQNSPTGGDLYDWRVLSGGDLHIAVVDAVGHGVGSTRDALAVTSTVRTLTAEGHSIGRVLAQSDRLLQTDEAEVIATVVLARLDPGTGLLRLADGGHPPPLLLRDGIATYLDAEGRPLGYPMAGSAEVLDTQLEPGDVVLLYTDGLIEIDRDILAGLDALQAAAGAASGRPLEEMVTAVLEAVTKGLDFRDDALLLALQWWGPTPG